MTRDNFTLLGNIAKTHGVRGELIIRTADPSYDLKEDWESIFLQIDGILVPFFISSLRSFKSNEWVVKLDWYEDRSQAEKLLGHPVWIDNSLLKAADEEYFMDELIGYTFTDRTSGQEGTITEFMDIPNNPVFEVDCKGEKILIPAREEFIIEFDPEEKHISLELPEGLIGDSSTS